MVHNLFLVTILPKKMFSFFENEVTLKAYLLCESFFLPNIELKDEDANE
jgi:hypothetical protein